jgi:hypothetical protein
LAVSIPTKITVPPDLNMSDPGDIAKVWSEIQITIQYINKLIDVLNDHKETLGLAVYYEE